MIRFVTGNLFESKADALVNTVNCVGIMGKGIAHQFKISFPEMFREYAGKCRRGEIRLGQMTMFRAPNRLIINFPTKEHWRAKSRVSDIKSGLQSLRTLLVSERIKSVAMPPLGCGNGGLNWSEVRPVIEVELADLGDIEVEVYEPVGGTFRTPTAASAPKLSLSHFVLVRLRFLIANANKLKVQKGAYFFNVYSAEDYFKFVQHKFGPYCVAIDPMLQTIRDYLDITGVDKHALVEHGLRHVLSGRDVERFRSWSTAIDRAVALCNALDNSQLEAVATVHAVVSRLAPVREVDLVREFLAWSPEKALKFTETDVISAVKHLVGTGLIRSTLVGYELGKP